MIGTWLCLCSADRPVSPSLLFRAALTVRGVPCLVFRARCSVLRAQGLRVELGGTAVGQPRPVIKAIVYAVRSVIGSVKDAPSVRPSVLSSAYALRSLVEGKAGASVRSSYVAMPCALDARIRYAMPRCYHHTTPHQQPPGTRHRHTVARPPQSSSRPATPSDSAPGRQQRRPIGVAPGHNQTATATPRRWNRTHAGLRLDRCAAASYTPAGETGNCGSVTTDCPPYRTEDDKWYLCSDFISGYNSSLSKKKKYLTPV